jgi:hypothetical protein
MKVRTRDGGGVATKCGDTVKALATIALPLSVVGEWLNGVMAT